MRVRLSQSACEMEAPLGYAAPGDRVRVAIRAGDILLATAQPHGLSARNVMEGRIVAMETRGARSGPCGLRRGIYRPSDAGSCSDAGALDRRARVAGAENALVPFRRGMN